MPHRTRIKICGLTREADVNAAVHAGADAIGFVLYPQSPRFVSPERPGEPVVNELHRRHPAADDPFLAREIVFADPLFLVALEGIRFDVAVRKAPEQRVDLVLGKNLVHTLS